MSKIFIVNGRGTAGKTTFETMVQNIAREKNKTVAIESTIDWVKQYAKKAGWDGSKTPESRRFLSDLKDALTRWNDVPYKKMQERLEWHKINGTNAVFIDCREPAEIQRFVDDYQATTILVQRGDVEVVIFGNHADDNVGNYQYDIIIDNSRGLAELEEEARIFVETFIAEE